MSVRSVFLPPISAQGRGFGTGGKVDHPFKVEVWEVDKVAETLAVAGSVVITGAAFDAAVRERPGWIVTPRQGAPVIKTTEPATAEPSAPPTVGQLRGLGVTDARLWCVGCSRHTILSWEALKAEGKEPFPRPAIGRQARRVAANRCVGGLICLALTR